MSFDGVVIDKRQLPPGYTLYIRFIAQLRNSTDGKNVSARPTLVGGSANVGIDHAVGARSTAISQCERVVFRGFRVDVSSTLDTFNRVNNIEAKVSGETGDIHRNGVSLVFTDVQE